MKRKLSNTYQAPGGQGERAAAQQHGNFVGVDLVVLGLADVNGAHVLGVAEDEIDPLVGKQVGEPVPGEHAFGPDDEVVSIRLDQAQENLGAGGNVAMTYHLPFGIEDTDRHGVGVQIDAAVKLVLLRLEFHGAGSFL